MLLEKYALMGVPWIKKGDELYVPGKGTKVRVGGFTYDFRRVEDIHLTEWKATAPELFSRKIRTVGESIEETVRNNYQRRTCVDEAVALARGKKGKSSFSQILQGSFFCVQGKLYRLAQGNDMDIQNQSFGMRYRDSSDGVIKKHNQLELQKRLEPQSQLRFTQDALEIELYPFTMRFEGKKYPMKSCTVTIPYDNKRQLIEAYPVIATKGYQHPFVWEKGKICLNEAQEWTKRGILPEKKLDNTVEDLTWIATETVRVLRQGYGANIKPVKRIEQFPQGIVGGLYENS